MRVEQQSLKVVVHCRCGRLMMLSIEGFFCTARGRWNFWLHDKQITYADARKRIDR
jgi:hypothetical protein